MLEKNAIDTMKLLRWLLGGALIGAGTRSAFGLYNQLSGEESLSPRDDLYDPEIEIPVEMSPAQMEAYRRSKVRLPKETGKVASAWDTTVNTLGVVGGAGLGWALASKVLESMKKRRLQKQLEDAQKELAQIVEMQPPEVVDEKTANLRALWDLVDSMAGAGGEKTAGFRRLLNRLGTTSLPRQVSTRHSFNPSGTNLGASISHPRQFSTRIGPRDIPEPTPTDLGGDTAAAGSGIAEKLRQIMDRLGTGASGTGKFVVDHPVATALGGGAAAAGASMIPGVSNVINRAGTGITNAVTSAAGVAGSPVLYGLISVLGPVAALSLLMGLYKGNEAQKAMDKTRVDTGALRKQIREQEAAETPYFKLTPVQKKQKATTEKITDPQIQKFRGYTDVDEDTDRKLKAAALAQWVEAKL
jgi:hypothetical protein